MSLKEVMFTIDASLDELIACTRPFQFCPTFKLLAIRCRNKLISFYETYPVYIFK